MTWQEKYEDTELMREFKTYLHGLTDFETWSELKLNCFLKNTSIKMWWGYLIVFAKTKGYYLGLRFHTKFNTYHKIDYKIISDIILLDKKEKRNNISIEVFKTP